MKIGGKLIMMLRDKYGYSKAIMESLLPNPNSNLRKFEESFESALDQYGIENRKACGTVHHFLEDNGIYQVSMLLLEHYEPPILACAIHAVLVSIIEADSLTMPTIVIPVIVASSKLKSETNNVLVDDTEGLLYGVKIGPETDVTQTLLSSTKRAPSSFKIHHESTACILQLVRVLNLPTFIIIGQSGRGHSLEVVCEIGGLLANTSSSLCFSRKKVTWNPKKTTRESQEPWRALYG